MLPGLLVKIGVDPQGLKDGLAEARSSLTDFRRHSDSIADGFKTLGDRASALGKQMMPISGAVSAIGAGAILLARNTAKAGDEIAKTARGVGLSGQAFQELAFAMGQTTGASQGEFASAMGRLNRLLGEAAAGSDRAADTLARMGIAVEDASDIGAEAAFGKLVEALQGTSSAADAAALASEALGRSGAQLGPILRESGADIAGLRDRARELGAVLGEDTLKASEQFNDRMDDLTKQFGGLKNAIGAELIPIVVNTLIPAIETKVIPALRSFVEGVASVIRFFNDLPGPVQEAIGFIAAAIGVGGPLLMAVGAAASAIGALVAATGPIGLLIAAGVLAYTAWQKWGDDIKPVVADAVAFIGDQFRALVGWFTALPETFAQIGRDIISGLRAGILEQWEGLKDTVTETAGAVSGWFKRQLGIESPSREFMDIGRFMMEGLAIGITDNVGIVRDAMSGVARQAVAQTEAMNAGVLASLAGAFPKIKAFAVAEAVMSTFKGMAKALELPFPANLAAAATVAAQGASFVAGIRSASPGGGGSPAMAGRGGASQAAAPSEAGPTTSLTINLQGDTFGKQSVRGLIDTINEALDDGARLRVRVA